jgi:metal-sulfur cluster biosynthetic enzyme
MPSRTDVERALAEVLDPEYPVSLTDLGLIRELEIADETVTVAISYCSLGCPCIDLIEQDVRDRLLQLDGVERVDIVESFHPWTRRDISTKGLTLLQGAGVA